MSPLEVLKAARKLIENGWAQGVLARDGDGCAVGVNSPEACQFCVAGAVARARDDGGGAWPAEIAARDALADSLPPAIKGHGLPSFNDYPGRTQREVLELFDKAIERAEAAK